jgi:hypothetical protein
VKGFQTRLSIYSSRFFRFYLSSSARFYYFKFPLQSPPRSASPLVIYGWLVFSLQSCHGEAKRKSNKRISRGIVSIDPLSLLVWWVAKESTTYVGLLSLESHPGWSEILLLLICVDLLGEAFFMLNVVVEPRWRKWVRARISPKNTLLGPH